MCKNKSRKTFVTNVQAGLLVTLVSALAAGIAAIVSRYRRDIQDARKRVESLGSQVIETAYGPVEFLRTGEGYPILVVHGAMGGFDQGAFLARNVSLLNSQVICISRFGYLRSPVPPGATLDLQADAYAGLLDAMGMKQAAVFAVSAGSTSAIRFAARHPDRISALILLGPDAPGEPYMALPPRPVFEALFGCDFLYWTMVTFFGKQLRDITGLVPKNFTLTPEFAALANRVQASDLPVSWRRDGMIFETYAYEAEFMASVTPASSYPLNQIRTPTLVINAADDPISLPKNVRHLAQQMPNARLYIVPDGGHLFFGHAEEVRSEITRFLVSTVPEFHKAD